MSAEAKETLVNTRDKVLSRNGGVFFLLFAVVSFFFVIAIQSRIAATDTSGPLAQYLPTPFVEPSSLAVGVPRWAAVLMVFASLYVGSYIAVVAMRAFVEESASIHERYYKEDVLGPTTHMFLGTLIFAPMFFLGLFLGVLPGAFIAISFCFYLVYTSNYDEDVIDAFMSSWDSSRGNRVPLFLIFLLFLIVFIVIVAAGLTLYVVVWGLSDVLAELMLVVGASVALVFVLSIVSSAHNTVCRQEAEG